MNGEQLLFGNLYGLYNNAATGTLAQEALDEINKKASGIDCWVCPIKDKERCVAILIIKKLDLRLKMSLVVSSWQSRSTDSTPSSSYLVCNYVKKDTSSTTTSNANSTLQEDVVNIHDKVWGFDEETLLEDKIKTFVNFLKLENKTLEWKDEKLVKLNFNFTEDGQARKKPLSFQTTDDVIPNSVGDLMFDIGKALTFLGSQPPGNQQVMMTYTNETHLFSQSQSLVSPSSSPNKKQEDEKILIKNHVEIVPSAGGVVTAHHKRTRQPISNGADATQAKKKGAKLLR